LKEFKQLDELCCRPDQRKQWSCRSAQRTTTPTHRRKLLTKAWRKLQADATSALGHYCKWYESSRSFRFS